MNLILITSDDLLGENIARLSGRRFEHIALVHRAEVGTGLRVGFIDGKLGYGKIVLLTDEYVDLEIKIDQNPPAALPLTLFLALPRPKVVPRILQTVTTLGVKRVFIFNCYRVEKIYWSCRQLAAEDVREACLLGLEQAGDTVLPEIHLCRLFKPFVEDELPSLISGTEALLAHPRSPDLCPFNIGVNGKPISLIIGPEGGFIDYEIEMLVRAGFKSVRSLDRVLKVETAIAALIGRLL